MKARSLAALLVVAALWALLLWTPWAKPPPTVAPQTAPVMTTTKTTSKTSTTPAPPPPAPAPITPAAKPPAAPAPEPAPSAAHATRLPQIMDTPPPQVQGPLRALEQRFGSESSSNASRANETKVKATFSHFKPPPDLLDDIVCRRSVCRISARWRQDRALAFSIGLNELRRDFDPNLAISEAGVSDADRFRRIEVYLDLASPRPPLP